MRTLSAPGLIIMLLCLSMLRSSVYFDEVTLWRDTVTKSPGKARVHNNLGRGYRLAHRTAEAMQQFERTLEIDPDHADALNNLATLYAQDHRLNDAVAILRRTLALNPNHLAAHFNLAMDLYAMGQPYAALEEYAIVLQLAPGSSEALFARQMLSQLSGRATNGR